MLYINEVIILQCFNATLSLHYCYLPKKAFLSPSVWAIIREYSYLETQLKGEFTDLL